MKTYILNGRVFLNDCIKSADILIENGIISKVEDKLLPDPHSKVIDASGLVVSPGFIDMHTHLREPGFCEKEDILSGTLAAARGGFTTVCSMPNLSPVPDCVENLAVQLGAIRDKAVVRVLPYASITRGEKGTELSDINCLSHFCPGFSDDGKGVQNGEMMKSAMLAAKKSDRFIAAHCEDESLLCGASVHDGEYAKTHGLKGISSESEYAQIERDIKLCELTGCRYHVCHISTAQGVELVRSAKKRGLPVTCEATPHHLALCDTDISEDSGRFKMNPPLRSPSDVQALRQGIADGTIDAIATDHAPHTNAEKSRGLSNSPFGIVGLETAFPVIYSTLVKSGIISLERAIYLMTISPSKILGIPCGIYQGARADVTLIDLDKQVVVNPDDFLSKGKSTAFSGASLLSEIAMTIVNGTIVYSR